MKPAAFFSRSGLLALLLCLGPALSLAADDRAEARSHATQAQALLEKGDAAQARTEAFLATGLDELSAKAWWALGQAEKALGHKDKARKAVERALELDPEGKDLDRAQAQKALADLVSGGAKAPSPPAGSQSKVMAAFAQYVNERDRGDRVSGQGSSGLADYGGDRAKAERAARRRALASLAEAMQTRITVITEASEASDEADSEIKASTKEEAEALLRDVDTRSYDEFPLPGRVTVLAWMDRSRYLQLLLDEKILRRSSGWGMAARIGGQDIAGLGGENGNTMHWGGELSYGPWTLGAFALNGPMIENASLYTGVTQSNTWSQGHLNGWGLEGGWDWVAAHPWRRFQFYAPLRFQTLSMTLSAEPQGKAPSGPLPSMLLHGLRGGLGVRWWGSDLFALETRATLGLGLNTVEMPDADGKPFYLKGRPVVGLKDEGFEFSFSVRIGWL